MSSEEKETLRKQILAQNCMRKEFVSKEEAEQHYNSCLHCQKTMWEYADIVAME